MRQKWRWLQGYFERMMLAEVGAFSRDLRVAKHRIHEQELDYSFLREEIEFEMMFIGPLDSLQFELFLVWAVEIDSQTVVCDQHTYAPE